MTEVLGNVAAYKAIHLYATECNKDKNLKMEPVFIASAVSTKSKEVNFDCKSFDTLTIAYNKKNHVFK